MAVPPVRGPLRTLVVEAPVTWPAVFVRRALEGESAFSVSSLQRAGKSVATRTGGPPPGNGDSPRFQRQKTGTVPVSALTRSALVPFEVAIIGGPDNLSPADLEALQWFVEARGGVVIFVPAQRPSGQYRSLMGGDMFDPRALEAPVPLGAELSASEFVVPRELPPWSSAFAADPQGNPVVFSLRRGAGAVVFSGALDAWRHRGQDEEAFARFWRRVVATSAVSVPPAVDVELTPALARPNERVTITVRVRDTELSSGADRMEPPSLEARAVGPQTKTDEAVRLWPTAEPGVFIGEWRAREAGDYNVSVSAGVLRGDAAIHVASDIVAASPLQSDDLALLARASGGRVFPAARLSDLTAALKAAYPARPVVYSVRIMRSPWWCVPFAALLCVEWTLRRRRGPA